jgi:hypothetical protein
MCRFSLAGITKSQQEDCSNTGTLDDVIGRKVQQPGCDLL